MDNKICLAVLTIFSLALVSSVKGNSESDLTLDLGDGFLVPGLNCSLKWFKAEYGRLAEGESYDPLAPRTRRHLNNFEKCKDEITKKLRGAVSGISEEAKESVKIFSGVIDGDFDFRNNRNRDVEIGQLFGGFMALLEHTDKDLDEEALLDPSSGKDYLSGIFHSTVDGICQEVYEELQPFIELYDTLGERNEVTKKVNMLTKEWLTRGRVCQVMLTKPERTIQLIFDALYREFYFKKYEDERNLYKELKELNAKIHAKYGPKMEPEELANKLKRMNEIFEKFHSNSLLTLPERKAWQTDSKLLEFSRFDEEKCNLKMLKDLQFIMSMNEYPNPLTIYPYLKHFAKKQIEFCEKTFRKLLDEEVSSLAEEQRKDIIKLGELTTIVTNCSDGWMDDKKVNKGVLEFLTTKPSEIPLDKTTTKEQLDQMFKQNLDELCNSLYVKTFKALRIYYTIANGIIKMQEMDQTAREWMMRGRVCGRISTVRDQVIRSVLKLLAEEPIVQVIDDKKKKKKHCNLFSCF